MEEADPQVLKVSEQPAAQPEAGRRFLVQRRIQTLDKVILDPAELRLVAIDGGRSDVRRTEGLRRPEFVVPIEAYADPAIQAFATVSLANVENVPPAVSGVSAERVDALDSGKARPCRIGPKLVFDAAGALRNDESHVQS